jgi:hypothetical protein
MTKKARLAIVCKTYDGDIVRFERLYKSLLYHNKDNIPFIISVPENINDVFRNRFPDVRVISDESYAGKYFSTEEFWGLSKGYINQEICKLSFWETGIALNYLFVDSDAYFIKDFYFKDFMADKETPYSVLVMDKDLNLQPYYQEFGTYRRSQIKKIFDYVGVEDKRQLTCHGMTVLNELVLRDLKNNLLQKQKMTYLDLVKISPYEYTWYNAWLQKSKVIDIIGVEPFFKTFHTRIEYLISRLLLITEEDLAREYVGIVLNSNWSPIKTPKVYRNPGFFCKVFNKCIRALGV